MTKIEASFREVISRIPPEVMPASDAHLWLYRPNQSLGDETPAAFIRRGRLAEVLAVVKDMTA